MTHTVVGHHCQYWFWSGSDWWWYCQHWSGGFNLLDQTWLPSELFEVSLVVFYCRLFAAVQLKHFTASIRFEVCKLSKMCILTNNLLTAVNGSFVWRRNWWHTLEPGAFSRSTCCPAAYSSVTTRGGKLANWPERHMGVEPLLHFPLFTIFTQQLPSRGHKRGILSNVSFLSGQAVKYTLTVRASLEGAEQRRFDMKGDEVAWKEILEADSGSKTISQL